jgi:hypothetical protein
MLMDSSKLHMTMTTKAVNVCSILERRTLVAARHNFVWAKQPGPRIPIPECSWLKQQNLEGIGRVLSMGTHRS